MDFTKKAVPLLFMAVSMFSVSSTLHEVGDVVGDNWNCDRSIDYSWWADMQQFKVGDVIHFTYDPGFDNLLQVSLSDYHSCNTDNPIGTFSSGDDYFKIEHHGHYFFICGSPDHCQRGQKVDIGVPQSF